jgi:hypothetical protein
MLCLEEGAAPPAPALEGLTLLLPAAAAALEREARRRGRTSAELIARLVRDYLRRQAVPRLCGQG